MPSGASEAPRPPEGGHLPLSSRGFQCNTAFGGDARADIYRAGAIGRIRGKTT